MKRTNFDPHARLVNALRIYCETSALVAVGLGCLALYGWTFHTRILMSAFPRLVTMKVNAAAGLAVSGASLWLLLPEEAHAFRGRAARVLAFLVALLGAATLSEYLFDLNLGIDQVLPIDAGGAVGPSFPGRMAPTTAIAFLAMGLALMLLDWKTKGGHRPAQVLSLLPTLISMVAISGYIYNATVLYSIVLYTQVALHTATALFLLSTAIFFARPRDGIAGDLTSEGSGSAMARRFLPAIFLIPISVGWILLDGQVAGLYGPEVGEALYTTFNVLVFAGLVWLSARQMNKEYDQRSRAEVEIRELNAGLELRVADRTRTLEQQAVVLIEQAALLDLAPDAVVVRDMNGKILFWNLGAETMYGWNRREALGRNAFELLSSEFSEPTETIEAKLLEQGKWHGEAIYHTRADRRLIVTSRWALQCDSNGAPIRVLATDLDITDRRHAEEALRNSEGRMTHSAQHDSLTGLPNRSLLNERVEQAIAFAHRQKKQFALLCLDLDNFKHINDSLGHQTGDKLLQSVGKRLTDCVRITDTVSRQGGDEFLVLLSLLDQWEDAAISARRILDVSAKAHSIGNNDLHVTTSIGVSLYPDDGLDADTLIKNADTAMYQAKENGRNTYQFFKPDMNVRAVERQSIEEHLRRALDREEFTLHYQPQVNLKTGAITGAEALIRWTHPTRGLVFPSQFIPVAEDCGLILPIGAWALREACAQAQGWVDAGLPAVTMAVNVSAMQFRSESFLDGLFATLRETGLDPRFLELEMTESLLMGRAELTAPILQVLRKNGVHVAIDDFGTGYSSLSYLHKFPIDALKIDQSFVRQSITAPNEASIVSAIISMGRSLKLRIIAEGVETPEELAFLQALQCDEAQGYYFSPPVPPSQFAKLLVASTTRRFPMKIGANVTPAPGSVRVP